MMKVYPSTRAIIRGVPGIANEINTLIGPYLDTVAEGGDVKEAIIETMKNALGVKKYRYNPKRVKDRNLADVKKAMSAEANAIKKQEIWDPAAAEEKKQRALRGQGEPVEEEDLQGIPIPDMPLP